MAKTLIMRADCLPSSLDSKAEEKKHVFNVLKANGYTKTFLRNFRKPALLMRGNQRLVLLLFLTFIHLGHNVKVLLYYDHVNT